MNNINIGNVYTTASGRKLEVIEVSVYSVFYRDQDNQNRGLQRLPIHEFRHIVGI